jgi:two-component system, LuxR family, response regulator FixJ
MTTSKGILFVIDDDPKSRKAVAALASSMQIECETFVSAEGFLDRYDPSLTGCALVDFRLGGMDGLQLQERLQALGSALSVILISAYAGASLAVRAVKNGAVAFIEKPYKNDELADAIRKALDRCTHAPQRLANRAEERPHLAAQELPTMFSRIQ